MEGTRKRVPFSKKIRVIVAKHLLKNHISERNFFSPLFFSPTADDQYTDNRCGKHNRDYVPGKEKSMKRYSETPPKVFICSPLRPHGETEEDKRKELHRNKQLARLACRYAVEHGYISRYELRNGHNGELMTPSLNFVFLELDRLKLGPSESDKCASLLERFVFSLKYMHTMTAKPAEFEDDLLNRLFQATELASMTVTTRQNYDKVMWTEIDQIATMNYATEKAMAKGKTETIMSFIKAGATDEMVAKATGLSAEEIAAMRKASQK